MAVLACMHLQLVITISPCCMSSWCVPQDLMLNKACKLLHASVQQGVDKGRSGMRRLS